MKIPFFGRDTGRHAMRDRDANVLVKILNALLNLIVKPGTRNELIVSDSNAVLTLNIQEIAAEVEPAAFQVKRAQITALAGDYLTCTLWDDDAGSFTGASVNVAKPPKLRNSIGGEFGFSYSYVNTNTRVATAAGYDSETYSVDRPYAIGEELKVANMGTTGVTAVTYEDLNNDARAWIAIPVIPIP